MLYQTTSKCYRKTHLHWLSPLSSSVKVSEVLSNFYSQQGRADTSHLHKMSLVCAWYCCCCFACKTIIWDRVIQKFILLSPLITELISLLIWVSLRMIVIALLKLFSSEKLRPVTPDWGYPFIISFAKKQKSLPDGTFITTLSKKPK